MNPEFIGQNKNDLCLLDFIEFAEQYGVDRFSYVRRATTGQTAGISVILFGNAAARELLPFLREHVTPLRSDASQRIIIQLATPLSHIFKSQDELRLPWSYVKVVTGTLSTFVFSVIGPSVTEEFANQLAERGVTISLNAP